MHNKTIGLTRTKEGTIVRLRGNHRNPAFSYPPDLSADQTYAETSFERIRGISLIIREGGGTEPKKLAEKSDTEKLLDYTGENIHPRMPSIQPPPPPPLLCTKNQYLMSFLLSSSHSILLFSPSGAKIKRKKEKSLSKFCPPSFTSSTSPRTHYPSPPHDHISPARFELHR